MPLTPQQLARLKSYNPTLTIDPSCTLIESYLEENVTLEKNVTIRNSHIGRNAVIGHHSAITRSRIGNDSRIPANTSISDHTSAANITPDPDLHLPLAEFLLEKFPQSLIFQKWSAANGDSTLRLNYPLNESSLVLDVGGYQGDFAHDIFARYRSQIEIFEPVAAFAEQIQRRFAHNPKVHLHPFGLAGATRSEQISLAAESSSTLRTPPTAAMQTIHLRAANPILESLAKPIDLLKINIEGGEYELLSHLATENLLPQIRHLQIQFHNFVPNAVALRRQLRTQLQQTHKQDWNYPFIWESWSRL